MATKFVSRTSTFFFLAAIIFVSVISTATATLRPPLVPIDPLPRAPSVNHAAVALHYAGFNSMSLIMYMYAADLPLIPIPFPPTSLTVFAPKDSAFAAKGQPSEPQLLHQFSSVYVSSESLSALASGSTLPNFSGSDHLTITPRNDSKAVFINNVRVDAIPIYDDGRSIVVYAAQDFFNLDAGVVKEEDGDHRCASLERFSESLDSHPIMFPVASVLRWMNNWCRIQGAVMDYSALVLKNLLFT